MENRRKYRKIIAAGHVCLDITPVFPDRKCGGLSEILAPGKMVHMEGVDVHVGGSVSNTGLALRILGNDVCLAGKIGDDEFGKIIQGAYAVYGAEKGLIVDKNSSSSYSVVLAVPGIDRIFLHAPGANDTYTGKDIPEEILEDAALFHFGYPPLMKKMFENDGEELKSMFVRMKARGIATSLDMAAVDPNAENGQADWKKILKKVLPYVDIFVPSFEEILFMLDRNKYDRMCASGKDICEQIVMEEDVAPLAGELLAMGSKIVLIKCGTAGMYYQTADAGCLAEVGERLCLDRNAWSSRKGIQPIFRVENVKSGTGAGDTSIAAFLTAVVRGKTPAESAELAAAEGACCVTAYDALSGLKTFDELEQMVRERKE